MHTLNLKETIQDVCNVSNKINIYSNTNCEVTILFAALCNTFHCSSWKTRKDYDGSYILDGGFMVGIDTPNGTYVHIFDDRYWPAFKCNAIEFARKEKEYIFNVIEEQLTAKKDDEEEE